MKKMTNTERIKSVVKSTLQMLFILSIFSLFFIADKLLGFIDDPINWGAYLYIALYAIIVSLVFGFLDKPKLETKILIFLLILWLRLVKKLDNFKYDINQLGESILYEFFNNQKHPNLKILQSPLITNKKERITK